MRIIRKLRLDEFENTRLEESPFKSQFSETMEWVLGISNDDLLYQFRKRSDRIAPGVGLGGWYGRQGFIFGQVFSYLSKMYKLTGDLRCKSKLYFLIDEWAGCMHQDGYALWPDADKYPNYSIAYEFEKLITGLVDAFEYAGYPHSHKLLSKMTDWATRNLCGKPRTGTFLGEWYTLPEGYLRAYEMFHDEKLLTFAEEWYYDELWNRFLLGTVDLNKPLHAYSTINSLSSLACLYLTSGEERLLDIMKNAYEDLTAHHIYATGGYGPQEDIFGKPGYLGDALLSAWDLELSSSLIRIRHDPQGNCEASCCAWAVIKFCKYLQTITKEAKYGHWMEKVLYNVVLPMPIPGNDGKIMYFASYYYDGAVKSNFDRRYHFTPDFYNDLGIGIHQNWACCTGTFPQNVTEYANLIYYFDDSGIYINQFLPSSTSFAIGNEKVYLQLNTRYPEEETVRLLVDCESSQHFSIRIRMPEWLKDRITITINGKKEAYECLPNQWLEITRDWGGHGAPDEIYLTIPLPLYFQPVDDLHSNLQALCYGPVVLCANDICLFKDDPAKPESWIIKKEGQLEFETVPDSVVGYDFVSRSFIPYYAVPPMQWYFMYCKFALDTTQE